MGGGGYVCSMGRRAGGVEFVHKQHCCTMEQDINIHD